MIIKYDINGVMIYFVIFVIIQFSIYLANSLLQANFSHFDDNGDFSNWFTLSLELGIGLPIAFVIGNHFFIKSVKKAVELFTKEQEIHDKEKFDDKGFIASCFNGLQDIIHMYKLEKYFDTTRHRGLDPIIIQDPIFGEETIRDLEDVYERLRSISSKEIQDIVRILREMIKLLNNIKPIPPISTQIEWREWHRFGIKLLLLIEKMKEYRH